MKCFKYALLFLSTAAIAGGRLPATPETQVPQTQDNCPWNIYVGAGAGIDFLRGKRDLNRETPAPITQRVSNTKLHDHSSRIEGYFGASWNVPNTGLWLGIEPFASYTNVKDRDFHNLSFGNFLGVPINDSVTATLTSKYSFGVDLRPSYNLDPNNSIYALIGTEIRHFDFRFQDSSGSISKTKHRLGFDWGLGYEHRFTESSIGLRFRHNIFSSKNIPFEFEGSTYNAKIKPRLYSVMLTYKYNLKG